jgi:hypothetical protein
VYYLNKFLVHVQHTTPVFCLKSQNQRTGQVNFKKIPNFGALKGNYRHLSKKIKVEEETEKGTKLKAKKVNILDAWIEHPKHLIVDGVDFRPNEKTIFRDTIRTDISENNRKQYLNIFVDFAYKIYARKYTERQTNGLGPTLCVNKELNSWMEKIKNTPLDKRTYLQTILEHVFRVYCCGNIVMFWAFNAFFCNMLIRPESRMGVCFVIIGDFGAGKSVLLRAIGEYMFGEGTLYHYMGEDSERLTSRFNAGFGGLYILVDEAEYLDPKDAGKIKSMITESTYKVEDKYFCPYTETNHRHFVYAGNSFANPMTEGDRRYYATKCDENSNHLLDIPEIRNNLVEACSDLGVVQYAYWLLANKAELMKYDFRVKPYLTDYKKERMLECMHPVYRWWKVCLDSGLAPREWNGNSYSEHLVLADNDPDHPANIRAGNDWSGISNWNTFYSDFAHKYPRQKNDVPMYSFVQKMKKCMIIKQAQIDGPFYFSCIAGCLAQFDIFLTKGLIHEQTTSHNAGNKCEWIKRLYSNHIKELKPKDNTVWEQTRLEELSGTFHTRCKSCSQCSPSWARLEEQGVRELLVETIQGLVEESRGILPKEFYCETSKQEQTELQEQSSKQPGSRAETSEWNQKRAADYELNEDLSSSSGEEIDTDAALHDLFRGCMDEEDMLSLTT